MKKNAVKLNESQLRKVVAESVKRVLREQIGNRLSYEEVKRLATLLKQKPLQVVTTNMLCLKKVINR